MGADVTSTEVYAAYNTSQEFACQGYGGRPDPRMVWKIKSQNLAEVDDIFTVREHGIGCEDM